MNVLIDTSVWVDPVRNGNQARVALMARDLALIQPMIISEIACGTPPAPRLSTLDNLRLLRYCQQASLSEVIDFVEREKLYCLGCG
jgi:predicted nucleic acid-binding protein